jgi:hypothetical protein
VPDTLEENQIKFGKVKVWVVCGQVVHNYRNADFKVSWVGAGVANGGKAAQIQHLNLLIDAGFRAVFD